ncbi:hypothetical protein CHINAEXTREME_15465 [Halobiforma lacisalsi AJ5]|uniref:Uncharacterized protein n=1 Tax=Natronobacterium lacisalsi AJ5 TaxID=358396 RepID=M0LGT8_NATLA|nr:hypothetical protein [Halobiforma lacisalsi]APW99088.1 hypothetical protein CHINAEXTREME_15465 [Halobiforma lacisalsi AJ5]EMA31205.1 hypothetical protein C445_14899 [Halobiforma lacisalsi AJ5]
MSADALGNGNGDDGPSSNARLLFVALLREEWRLHTRLFGGWRFAFFPLVVAAVAVAGTVALLESGLGDGTILLGVHVLAAGFGLYSGTAAFAGSDMLENVFGDLSLLLGSAETLPLSRRRLLGLFLLKDGLFYAVVFVLPMAAAAVVLVPATTPGAILVAVVGLWLSLSLAFAVGMTATVGSIAVRTRGVPTWAIAAVIALVAVVVGVSGGSGTAVPYVRAVVVPLEAGPLAAVGIAAGTVLLAAGALVAYDPTYGRPTRTVGDRFAALTDRLPLESGSGTDALVAKTLLDLSRSSGGVWKPLVSATILFALVAALVGIVDAITGIEPAPGIFFGGVLGLSAFTTYNWLTQFDALESYLVYPIGVEDVFRAKRTAFVLVGAPTVLVPYLAAVAWFDATALDAAVGAVLLAGYGLYYYGLTVYVAGFDPNEFLFDAVRFGAFTVGVAVALVPALVVGFVVVPPSLASGAALAAAGLAFGLVGFALSSRAGPRWERRYRIDR